MPCGEDDAPNLDEPQRRDRLALWRWPLPLWIAVAVNTAGRSRVDRWQSALLAPTTTATRRTTPTLLLTGPRLLRAGSLPALVALIAAVTLVAVAAAWALRGRLRIGAIWLAGLPMRATWATLPL